MALLQEPDVEDIIELNEYQVGPEGTPVEPVDEEGEYASDDASATSYG